MHENFCGMRTTVTPGPGVFSARNPRFCHAARYFDVTLSPGGESTGTGLSLPKNIPGSIVATFCCFLIFGAAGAFSGFGRAKPV
jgi:hypothetical protein